MSRSSIGFTGHQTLTPETRSKVRAYIELEVSKRSKVLGICSLAAGADQLFADVILATSNELEVIVPSAHYSSTFQDPSDLRKYNEYLAAAVATFELEYDNPTEEAFYAAGCEVVRRSQVLLAVWDGKPAAGFGGTADVVVFARDLGREILVVWPPGAARE